MTSDGSPRVKALTPVPPSISETASSSRTHKDSQYPISFFFCHSFHLKYFNFVSVHSILVSSHPWGKVTGVGTEGLGVLVG